MTIRRLVTMMNTCTNPWLTIYYYNGCQVLFDGHYWDAPDEVVSEDVLEFTIDALEIENDWGAEVSELTVTTYREI